MAEPGGRSPECRHDAKMLPLTMFGLAVGLVASMAGAKSSADVAWGLTTVAGLAWLSVSVVRDVLRREPGVDVIALLAMGGSLAVGEHLAGAVIAVMLASGRRLELYAAGRAQRELSALLERAPRIVHRQEGRRLTSPPLDDVRPGDLLVVMTGEVVPVDGRVEGVTAVLDESALTGEAGLVERSDGAMVASGCVNAGATFHLRATTTSAGSTYAGIVRLVESAQAEKAPFVRLADRWALAFLPVALGLAGLAWASSGQVVRGLAVLVVATPCPLILAAPVAIVSGISRAARRGIIVKGGGALESLARARVLLFDKTGTLTAGKPVLTSVEAVDINPVELLRLAASLGQASPHVLADAIVRAAHERSLLLSFPKEAQEVQAKGVCGVVEGHYLALGRAAWVSGGKSLPPWARRLRRRAGYDGSAVVYARIDDRLAGALVLEDPIRPCTPRTIREVRRAGVEKVVMVTGDHVDVAETVGAAIGVDHVLAERTPADKVEAVRAELSQGTTIMVGDGINDAPALAPADVGVAMGARGATASSEAADVVLTVDRLDRLSEALQLARRSRRIALQSVGAGMGLSVVAMVFALAGAFTPVAGAFLQEAIDVAMILNALRALRGGVRVPPRLGTEIELGRRFHAEHRELLGAVDGFRLVADRLDVVPPSVARAEVEEVHRFLVERLLPHASEENTVFYPVMARLLGGDDPTGPMLKAHAEIGRLTRLLGRLLDDFGPDGPEPDDLPDLRRLLYGLYAILKLHIAQEEEAFLSLLDHPEAEEPLVRPTEPTAPPATNGARSRALGRQSAFHSAAV